jgi:recombination protein RecA
MAEKKTLAQIIRETNKNFGDSQDKNKQVISLGVDDLTAFGTLSFGSPGLDFCLYNSLPEKRIIEFCGPESSGKTSTAYLVAASYQRKELERNPEDPRKILFVDLECGADPMWAEKFGYKTNGHPVQTVRFTGSDMPAESIFDVIYDSVKSEEVGLVIIDSLNMLTPLQTYGESFEKKDMGGVAKALGDFVRRITGLLIKYDCTLIGINQIRENIGGYGNPITTSGGRAWRHACSVRMMFKKDKFFDEEGNEVKSTAESPAGYIMEAAVLKTKVCKWDRKVGRLYINYDRGVDIMQDTIDVATYFGLIVSPAKGYFKIIDTKTGEILNDENGEEIKIHGMKNLKPFFEEHLELWKNLYDAVYEKLSKKDDPNVKLFEEMLNSSSGEFGVDLNKEEE